jgi:NAD(P)-dependent dehydrogenase (short-subunit alcohol dehydrogenase family)
MDKKIALVTGANSGMGKATVAALADKGMHVVMLCRSEKRGQIAFDDLMQNKARSIDLMLCDLGSLSSTRQFANAFSSKYDRLDVLVGSAGVITLDRRETSDGLELAFGVNHIGHFALTLLLLKSLSKADSARIVMVGSGAHNVGRIHFDDINLTKGYTVVRSYSQSKLANLLFTRELAKRLKESGCDITVNIGHPGAVGTQMGVDRDTGFGKTIMRLLRPFFLTPEQGARTAVYLATDDSVKDVSGAYFYKCQVWRSSKRSRDMQSAKRLFELSESISGITFDQVMQSITSS